jgi:hypothetical protein
MTFEQTRLSALEETKALIDAGINPDIETWSEETLDRAAIVLDAAQTAKIERLTAHHKAPAHTLADMTADLADYHDKTPEEA